MTLIRTLQNATAPKRNELFASGFGTSHRNATEAAEELGIGLSTLAEHLVAVQEKLMDELLAD